MSKIQPYMRARLPKPALFAPRPCLIGNFSNSSVPTMLVGEGGEILQRLFLQQLWPKTSMDRIGACKPSVDDVSTLLDRDKRVRLMAPENRQLTLTRVTGGLKGTSEGEVERFARLLDETITQLDADAKPRAGENGARGHCLPRELHQSWSQLATAGLKHPVLELWHDRARLTQTLHWIKAALARKNGSLTREGALTSMATALATLEQQTEEITREFDRTLEPTAESYLTCMAVAQEAGSELVAVIDHEDPEGLLKGDPETIVKLLEDKEAPCHDVLIGTRVYDVDAGLGLAKFMNNRPRIHGMIHYGLHAHGPLDAKEMLRNHPRRRTVGAGHLAVALGTWQLHGIEASVVGPWLAKRRELDRLFDPGAFIYGPATPFLGPHPQKQLDPLEELDTASWSREDLFAVARLGVNVVGRMRDGGLSPIDAQTRSEDPDYQFYDPTRVLDCIVGSVRVYMEYGRGLSNIEAQLRYLCDQCEEEILSPFNRIPGFHVSMTPGERGKGRIASLGLKCTQPPSIDEVWIDVDSRVENRELELKKRTR